MFAYTIVVFILYILACTQKEDHIVDVLIVLPIFGRIFGWW